MAIRWVSNPESIKANQPSVLAIAETLAAMCVSVWIAVTWDTYLHIAIGASIAPLLLMRTDESCIRGLVVIRSLAKPLELVHDFQHEGAGIRKWLGVPAFAAMCLVWIPTMLLVARVVAGVTYLVQHPVVAAAAIPSNWRSANIVIDSKNWPHILAKPRDLPDSVDEDDFWDVGEIIEGIRSDVPQSCGEIPVWLLMLVVSPFVILPAFVYRWSLKSTAIIWFPLLWAWRSVREAGKPLGTYLDIYLRDLITKIVLWLSLASIIGFVAKFVLFNVQTGFVAWWNTTALLRFFSLYVAPAEIQWWQMAMVINSAIAIGMYILARRWLVRIEHKVLTDEALPRKLFQVGLFIRPILSCYTIACTLYITIRAASEWNLPALGSKLFPWW